jgi:hypothetical protein
MFGKSYADSFTNCYNWIAKADRTTFRCANRQYQLLDGAAHVTWSATDCNAFLEALKKLWVDGK